jgi:RimJ/RimL family protein N-acetyltransferase
MSMAETLILRPVTLADLDAFFEQQTDPEANRMAAFTAKDPADRAAFALHWGTILSDPEVVVRTIEVDGVVAGHVARFLRAGTPEITYWIGRAHWGRGVATAALAAFLDSHTERPLHARVAADNAASLRVLEKCGFTRCSRDRGFANARGAEIDELVLRLS